MRTFFWSPHFGTDLYWEIRRFRCDVRVYFSSVSKQAKRPVNASYHRGSSESVYVLVQLSLRRLSSAILTCLVGLFSGSDEVRTRFQSVSVLTNIGRKCLCVRGLRAVY